MSSEESLYYYIQQHICNNMSDSSYQLNSEFNTECNINNKNFFETKREKKNKHKDIKYSKKNSIVRNFENESRKFIKRDPRISNDMNLSRYKPTVKKTKSKKQKYGIKFAVS